MQDAEPRLDTKTITEQIISADSIPRVWKVFSAAMVSFKFDKLLYGGSRFPTQRVLGDIREALILHLGPQAYADVYLGEELYLHSPTYDWAEKNNGFASWPDALRQFKGQPSPQQMRILQLNARFGIIAGYVGSLNAVVPGMNGVIGISPAAGLNQNDADEIWTRDGKDIETLCNLMHLRISSLPQTGQRRPLTSRQRESLEWYSQGKTAQEIATIMNVSVGTVEKHLKMARDSLDALTTAHAVKKATSLNLLTA